jgi:P4 family phage/plasmid primase-like protien
MYKHVKQYLKKNLVVFSLNIEQKQHKNEKWKKEITFPPKWTNFTLNNSFFDKTYNGLGILTGKINNIIVIDIDNLEHWNKLLNENNQQEPNTVKVISGSGGIHFYFTYDAELETIKSKDHCFRKDYDIDIKTNGGCVICPPSSYFNKNLNKEVKYDWEKNIFDNELAEIPQWIKNLLLNKTMGKNKKKIKQENKDEDCDIIENNNNTPNINDKNLYFTEDEIDYLTSLLSTDRCENYNEWITIGMILYNIDKDYKYIWRKWSKQSDKYEEGCCEEKWKSFKDTENNITIGTLLLWCKKDNELKYSEFMKNKKLGNLINKKYPDEKLILGKTVFMGDKSSFTDIKNLKCLIKGEEHKDMKNSMYVDITDKFMSIKCKHPECFGKIYPCNHILMNKNETNIAFYGNVNITINNNKCEDDELVDFQQIDLYKDEIINKLVFDSLNGESYPLAKVIYHFYPDKFNYGEDNCWYIYEEHRWKNIGNKNLRLRDYGQEKLKEIFSDLLNYYRENNYDKNQIKSVKQIKKSIDNTAMKNNIMTELMEVYMLNNNLNNDFTKKLDNNNYLIGFNNGVYDLQKFEFREGQFNDYITLTTGYNYNEQHTEKYIDLLKFLEDIQPNQEEREYMLTYLSIGLYGNLLELFTILTGCGRNGKSKLIELLGKTFGEYFGSVQSQMFTRPRPDANSPDPGLLSLMKKRVVIASEPEKNSKLNSGFIKFITGRDSTTLRNCHSNDMIEFTAKFQTLLICNDIPDCDDIDNAFSKRLRCINFPTEFVAEPKNSNHKKIDVNINQNFNYWKLDFMLLLIEYYKKYIKDSKLMPTANILLWTNQYKEDTDMYLQFLNECTDKSDIHIKTFDIYECFKSWFKINNPNTKIPSNREFISNVKKYKTVEHVKLNGVTCYGIKNLKLNSG